MPYQFRKRKNVKTLIIYGSRWGGTVLVAEKIRDTLKKQGYSADAIDAKKNFKTLSEYDLFIVGSGIRADKWTKETMQFLKRNAELLRTKKIAMFVSCLMAEKQDQAGNKAKKQYLENIAELYGLKPISFGYFGGFIDFRKSHGLIVDIMTRINRNSLRKNGLDTSKIHDTRNWSNIEAWTHELAKVSFDK